MLIRNDWLKLNNLLKLVGAICNKPWEFRIRFSSITLNSKVPSQTFPLTLPTVRFLLKSRTLLADLLQFT